jgi:hypothetical protein
MPAIEAKVKEAEAREADLRIVGIKAKRDMIAVLTSEQQTKLKALRHGDRHADGRTLDQAPRRSEQESDRATPAG